MTSPADPRRRRFWFPFAFKDAGFCRKLLTGPEVRAAVRSQTMERSITFALARSTDVVACIESKLRDPDPNMAVANNVLRAVMGCICYNVWQKSFFIPFTSRSERLISLFVD